jgi:hypothetical protein
MSGNYAPGGSFLGGILGDCGAPRYPGLRCYTCAEFETCACELFVIQKNSDQDSG